MAKEFIYQVRKGQAVEEYDYITPGDFYEDELVCAWSDFFYDEEDLGDLTAFDEFSNLLDAPRFKEVVKINSEEETVTLYPGFKEAWFEWKFNRIKELVNNATLAEFVSDSMLEYNIRYSLGASFDAFIYDEENGYPKKIDAYFRSLDLSEPVTFHFGGLVMFHY